MAHRVPIKIQLESFEGPLDLLLYLIQENELDISRISITRVTDQYLRYVQLMEELNFEIASEFLLLAATLLYWKSKAILPKEGDEKDQTQNADEGPSPEELILQILRHKQFLAAGDDLAQLPRLHEDIFVRPNQKPPIERIWRQMNITDLALGYQEMLIRERRRSRILRKETVSIGERMGEFVEKLTIGRPTDMMSLLGDHPIRPEIVVSFLASLELSRMKKMRVHQNAVYAPIYLELLEKAVQFGLHFSSEFDLKPLIESREATPAPEIAPMENVG